MPSTSVLLSSYPRKQPPLSEAHRRIYASEYQRNRSGKGLLFAGVRLMESWMHRRIARGARRLPAGHHVLELGAGGLNHVPFEPPGLQYDVVEPLSDLCKASANIGRVSRIHSSYDDLASIKAEETFQRVISIAELEHLTNLPWVVAHSARLLGGADGLFQAGIPSEGGALWAAAWKLTTGLRYRLVTGLDYGQLLRHEHINNAPDICQVVRYFFNDVKCVAFRSRASIAVFTPMSRQDIPYIRPIRVTWTHTINRDNPTAASARRWMNRQSKNDCRPRRERDHGPSSSPSRTPTATH